MANYEYTIPGLKPGDLVTVNGIRVPVTGGFQPDLEPPTPKPENVGIYLPGRLTHFLNCGCEVETDEATQKLRMVAHDAIDDVYGGWCQGLTSEKRALLQNVEDGYPLEFYQLDNFKVLTQEASYQIELCPMCNTMNMEEDIRVNTETVILCENCRTHHSTKEEAAMCCA